MNKLKAARHLVREVDRFQEDGGLQRAPAGAAGGVGGGGVREGVEGEAVRLQAGLGLGLGLGVRG